MIPRVWIVLATLALAACGDTMGERALSGGAIGAGAGAAGGALAGHAGTGALIGGGVGAATGALTTPSTPPPTHEGYYPY